MNARYAQDDSPESVEGTAAHWVVSEMLAGRTPAENTAAPNGAIVTGEMLDGAELACDTVARRMAGLTLHIEETVSIPEIHADCFGTPDIWGYAGGHHLEIIDYKFGHGFVDEHFNLQGITYASGILAQLGNPEIISIAFTIVQPRCYYRGEPVRTHQYTTGQMRAYIAMLQKSASYAMHPKPVATTGQQCEHCPGRHACPALQRAAYSDAETSTDRQPHDLTPSAAALELRMLERALSRLEARVDGLRELTIANIKAGRRIPHYRAEPGRGRQQWTAAPEQIITIGQMLGKDLAKPGLVTPAQAKKLGIDEAVISAYSAITPGTLKLVAENNSDAIRVFGRSGE